VGGAEKILGEEAEKIMEGASASEPPTFTPMVLIVIPVLCPYIVKYRWKENKS